MTIALAVASNDGVVLASDSASTTRDANGRTFIFHHKRKIFPLHESLPVAVVTAGLNRLAGVSVSSLCIELSKKLSKDEKWKLDPKSYTIEQVADRLKELIFVEHYLPLFEKLPKENRMTFFVAGYSAGNRFPEVVRFLAETEMKFSRFSPEPDTVGGALQLATISQHDGFRWLERGHEKKN